MGGDKNPGPMFLRSPSKFTPGILHLAGKAAAAAAHCRRLHHELLSRSQSKLLHSFCV